MGKGRFFGSVLLVAVIVLAAAWGGGCGQSNDQGISFRTLGFFSDFDGSVGQSGTCASLSDDVAVPSDSDGDGEVDGGILGIQNNLAQGIFLDHINLSYRVSGSPLSIPNDQDPLSARLGPSSGQEPGNPSTIFARILVVSPAIMEFLNNNRNQLPEPPFTMVASAAAVGVSDAGDTFTSNRSSYAILFVDGACVPPTPEPTEAPEPTATPTP